MKLGFISDAHGNTGAFEQGLALLDACACDEVFFLGDAVGYLPDVRVVQIVPSHGVRPVLGNHELMLLAETVSENEAVYQLRRCRELMSETDIAEICSWPAERRLNSDAVDLWMMHGSPTSLGFGYIYPDTDLDIFGRPPASITVIGNTHRPFWRCSSRGAWFLNPGSCGMPRDCGDLGSVAVLDTKEMLARILRFDIRESTHLALARCAPVHESVITLFDRPRSSNLVGEIYAS